MYTYWIETRYPDGTTNYNCGDYETIEETMEQIEAMRDNETLNEFGIDYIVRQDTETQECIEIEIDSQEAERIDDNDSSRNR